MYIDLDQSLNNNFINTTSNLMITHNVYIWLKEGNLSPTTITLFENALKKLVSNEGIIISSWGSPAQTPEREVTDNSFHYGVSIQFESVDAHNTFQKSQEHDEFLDSCAEMFEKVLVFDVEQK